MDAGKAAALWSAQLSALLSGDAGSAESAWCNISRMLLWCWLSKRAKRTATPFFRAPTTRTHSQQRFVALSMKQWKYNCSIVPLFTSGSFISKNMPVRLTLVMRHCLVLLCSQYMAALIVEGLRWSKRRS